jgi:hypothetical protein
VKAASNVILRNRSPCAARRHAIRAARHPIAPDCHP